MKGAVELTYLVAALLFIGGLKRLGSPATARAGNLASAVGMLLAVVATLVNRDLISFRWILLGLAAGGGIGVLAAKRVAMTGMPEMVALLNGFGGLASALVACENLHRHAATDRFTATAAMLSTLIGGVTFAGSMVAWGKLNGILRDRTLMHRSRGGGAPYHILSGLLLASGLALVAMSAAQPVAADGLVFYLLALSLVLGALAVVQVGGADMPVVISMLNSFSGVAACSTGFVLRSNILIVAGALVGASGLILTRIMCLSMNRSLGNVLFGRLGSGQTSAPTKTGSVKTISPEQAWTLLEAAHSIVVVPGYGMAVAQAQHAVRELADLLEVRGAEVRYAIHPVAGRMPGHMNVLLAEANVPYDRLVEMDTINPALPTVDVCLVVGANDVVNPAAREDQSSPLAGMPIINADSAKAVIVLKRTLGPGFAGVENSLFFKPNTRLLLGDAKSSLQALIAEFRSDST